MVAGCYRYFVSVIAAVLLLGPSQTIAATTTAPPHAANTLPATCEFRTINYITDNLPQLCGKSSWSSTNVTSATKVTDAESMSSTGDVEVTDSAIHTISSEGSISSPASTDTIQQTSSAMGAHTATSTLATESAVPEKDELDDSSFLSFGEWKEQTLKKAGQNNPHIGTKRSGEKHRDSDSMAHSLEAFGDEGEIDLGFAFTKPRNDKDTKPTEVEESDDEGDAEGQGVKRKEQYRSNDAGKTCKQRFNFASFDAGATVLKTHLGAKNSKAILVENKDTYMLSKCATTNKFLIVELSEDIWIDTLVLASYEFFSSMIRTFQVSVSEKYPVKMDKWKVVGTYEARNSREIQAFLIENPQIWARYIRVEFLTHYGNEFYCPLSLVRVHGTRMLDSWKENEANGDVGDPPESIDEPAEPAEQESAVDPVKQDEAPEVPSREPEAVLSKDETIIEVQPEAGPNSAFHEVAAQLQKANTTCPWIEPNVTHIFLPHIESGSQDFCTESELPVTQREPVPTNAFFNNSSPMASTGIRTSSAVLPGTAPLPTNASTPTALVITSSKETSKIDHPSQVTASIPASSSSASKVSSEARDNASPISSKSQNATTTQKSKTSTAASASSAVPTIQESFFKSVSRRLQLLETNSTLSLGYIEEQSRILREAFSKVEKKQLQKATSFLDTLNSTVLAELRTFRQQYDEIWQSTVISLEGQREESQREILAISARLNILADEVVFQKRMSIIQSVLLLLCLALVIFSRVSGSNLDIPLLHSRARAMGLPLSPLESPPQSPDYNAMTPLMEREEWLDHSPEPEPVRHKRQCLPSMDNTPPTPISTYSRSDDSATPPSDGLANSNGELQQNNTHTHLAIPSRNRMLSTVSAAWDTDSDTSQLSAPLLKWRKGELDQQFSSEIDNDAREDDDNEDWLPREADHNSSPLLSYPPNDSMDDGHAERKPLPPLPSDNIN
ncbi:UNC-like C-terminal-domain-containing protein [Calycina marina]|uniref:UNC-like C-terminal-domain-containing protein n=1 Tax=Calycina marina TaxID=1763456 RepID=A0A9P7Z6V1_9HELO|nr:UNC-like C-terminal-domain-containing protein [Calycina marina]